MAINSGDNYHFDHSGKNDSIVITPVVGENGEPVIGEEGNPVEIRSGEGGLKQEVKAAANKVLNLLSGK